MRRSFYYFFYFQLHRIFIDTEIAANDLTQSMMISIQKLGLSSAGNNDSTGKKKDKLEIPRHEDMPKEEKKEAPVPYAELKIFQHKTA